MHVLLLSKKLIGSWEGAEMENCLCSLEGRVDGRVNIIPSPHVTEEAKTLFCNVRIRSSPFISDKCQVTNYSRNRYSVEWQF